MSLFHMISINSSLDICRVFCLFFQLHNAILLLLLLLRLLLIQFKMDVDRLLLLMFFQLPFILPISQTLDSNQTGKRMNHSIHCLEKPSNKLLNLLLINLGNLILAYSCGLLILWMKVKASQVYDLFYLRSNHSLLNLLLLIHLAYDCTTHFHFSYGIDVRKLSNHYILPYLLLCWRNLLNRVMEIWGNVS